MIAPDAAAKNHPGQGIWSVLERSVLANLAVASFAHLVQVIRRGLKKIQYQPGSSKAASPGQGWPWDQAQHPTIVSHS